MRVLLIGSRNHQFIVNYVFQFQNEYSDVKFDIFSYETFKCILPNDKIYSRIYDLASPKLIKSIPLLNKVFFALLFIFKLKKALSENNYDIVHIQYIENFISLFSKTICRLTKSKLIISVWGSDYLKANKIKIFKMRFLFARADVITIASSEVKDHFLYTYRSIKNLNSKINNLSFGLAPLDDISKITKIPSKFLTITIGYNARKNQQHLRIIDCINRDKYLKKWKDQIKFIIPLTYPNDQEYVSIIESRMNASGFNYAILTNYLTDLEIAKLRVNTDIFIQLQETDMMSGSMLEHLAANNIVITGSWLPYSNLKTIGLYYMTIDSVDSIGEKLVNVISNYESLKQKTINNKVLVFDNFRWESVISKWYHVYMD